MTNTTATAQVHSFADADAYLLAGRNRDDRPAPTGNATRLVRTDADTITVYYHRTGVLTYKRDGRTLLHIGGYATKTTAQRIAEYLPGVFDATVGMPAYVSEGVEYSAAYDYIARPHVSVIGQRRDGRGDSIGITSRAASWPRTAPRIRKCGSCHGSKIIARGWDAGCACGRCDDAGRQDYGSKLVPIIIADDDVLVIMADGTTTTEDGYTTSGRALRPDVYACTCKMCEHGYDSWQEMYAATWRIV